MEEALRARLVAATALVALVPANRIVWGQRVGLPAIALHLVNDRPDYHMRGASGLRDAVVQIDVWASTASAALAIAREVEAALSALRSGIFQGVFLEGRRSGSETDTAAPDGTTPTTFHRQSLDFRVWHSTAN